MPVFDRCKLEFCMQDGMHLVHAVLTVKRCVTAKKKVGDHAYSPHVHWFAVS
jgi:hypothetical protein